MYAMWSPKTVEEPHRLALTLKLPEAVKVLSLKNVHPALRLKLSLLMQHEKKPEDLIGRVLPLWDNDRRYLLDELMLSTELERLMLRVDWESEPMLTKEDPDLEKRHKEYRLKDFLEALM